ncbi:MAG: S9 family peptidase, partial [Pyrinomonadaceae bacterium]
MKKTFLLCLTLFVALASGAQAQDKLLTINEIFDLENATEFGGGAPLTLKLNGANNFNFKRQDKNLSTETAEKLEADVSPDGKYASFVRGMNLYVTEVATGKEMQLTKDGDENTLNGYLDWVYEEELYGRGNKRGYWWSPDSTAIAFLRTDESSVPKFAVVNHISQTNNPAEQVVEDTPYPKAGDPNPIVKLGVANIKTGAIKFVDTANYKPEDFLISRVTWSPDATRIVYQAQNREQNFLDLNAADRNSGVTKTLFKETSPAWVEVIDNPTYLKDGSFVWQSAARSGWKHIYHFAPDGKLIKPLTSGDWEVRELYGVDEKNGFVYFSSTKDSTIAPQVYRIKLDGSGLQKISTGSGSHEVSFSKDFTRFTDFYSDVNTPPQASPYNADGSPIKLTDRQDFSRDMPKYKLGKTEFIQVKTRDGFQMEALMIKPADFDSSKKYPVIQFTYSGPHAPQVQNEWLGATGMWYQLLAEKGYIIWICDNRTASGKGVQSEYGVYKNFGESELRDLEDGISYLKTLPFVDASRIGLHGWSFGGYMTAFALTHSKSWKMGIAGGTVSDWSLYDSIYTERYMKTPQNNPEGYRKSSVTAAAGNLSGKLLLIHGAIDDNVHLQNAMQLIYALQKAGKSFEFMPYPTQRHGV